MPTKKARNWKYDPPGLRNWYRASICREYSTLRYWHGPGVGWSWPCFVGDSPETMKHAKDNIAGYQDKIEWLVMYSEEKTPA